MSDLTLRVRFLVVAVVGLSNSSFSQSPVMEFGNSTGPVHVHEDIDGDGVRDISVELRIFSGADKTLIHDASDPSIPFSADLVGDFNGDMIPDVAFLRDGVFSLYSGLTSALIASVAIPGVPAFLSSGRDLDGYHDLNNDGVLDVSYWTANYKDRTFGFVSGKELLQSTYAGWNSHDYQAFASVSTNYTRDGSPVLLVRHGSYLIDTVRVLGFDQDNTVNLEVDFSSLINDYPLSHGFVGIVQADDDGVGDPLFLRPGEFVPHSGVTLAALPNTIPTAAGGSWNASEDLNCDGIYELFLTDGFSTQVLSGKDGSLLFTFPSTNLSNGSLTNLEDLTGDGVGEFSFTFNHVATFVWDGQITNGQSYCVGKVSSQGCTPEISAAGSPSASGTNDFFVMADQVLAGTNGLLFWGVNGRASLPFLGGTLCVQPPLSRGPITVSSGLIDCEARLDVFFSHGLAASKGVQPGATVQAQFWMRDREQLDGTGVVLSNAYEFGWCP